MLPLPSRFHNWNTIFIILSNLPQFTTQFTNYHSIRMSVNVNTDNVEKINLSCSQISNTGCIFNLFRNLEGCRGIFIANEACILPEVRLRSPPTAQLTLLCRACQSADHQFLSSVSNVWKCIQTYD